MNLLMLIRKGWTRVSKERVIDTFLEERTQCLAILRLVCREKDSELLSLDI